MLLCHLIKHWIHCETLQKNLWFVVLSVTVTVDAKVTVVPAILKEQFHLLLLHRKLKVPSISASPLISKLAPSTSPVTVIESTNASFHLTLVEPKSTSLSDCGPKMLSPKVYLLYIC